MAIFSAGIVAVNSNTTTPSQDAQAAAGNIPRVLEVEVRQTVAATANWGLGRSANTPSQLSGLAVLSEDYSNNVGQTKIAATWTTAPTVPTSFFRRYLCSGTNIANGVCWTFPRGISLQPAGPSLVIWNIASNIGFPTANFVVDE